jgi:hypothetical protein
VRKLASTIRTPDDIADCFLSEFLNRGWSAAGPNVDWQTFDWFRKHPRFGRLLPAEPREFPNGIGVERAATPIVRFGLWQAILRIVWLIREEERARTEVLTILIRIYDALSSSEPLRRALTHGLMEFVRKPGEIPSLSGFWPRPDAFLDVLFRARDIAWRIGKCRNPSCKAPFFIGDRSTQTHCSRQCRDLMEQARKRRWWQEHGNEWRRKRKQKIKRNAGKSQRKGGKRR